MLDGTISTLKPLFGTETGEIHEIGRLKCIYFVGFRLQSLHALSTQQWIL